MAFSDWTPFNGGDVVMTQTSLNPIAGSGSLRMECGGATSADTASILPDTAGSLPHGFNKGRLQSLFRVEAANATGIKTFGLVANVTDELDPNGSADAYGMIVEMTSATDWDTIRLVKWSGSTGLEVAFSVIQTVVIGVPVDIGDTFAFQFDWISDVPTFGGTKLVCRFQESATFTAIPAIIDVVDAVSPIITSQSEGFYLSCDDNGGTITVNGDTTSLFEIT
jgi:hypothetical protein